MAQVHIAGTRRGALSDTAGFFRIDSLPDGAHTVVAALWGYHDDSVNVHLDADSVDISFRLLGDSLTLSLFESGLSSPKPYEGDIRVGFWDAEYAGTEPRLKMALRTVEQFHSLGFAIAAEVDEMPGKTTLELLGVQTPYGLVMTATGPAVLNLPLDLPSDSSSHLIEIRRDDQVDRYELRRTPSHLYYRTLEASFTDAPGSELELIRPGTTRIVCFAGTAPSETCEEFLESNLRAALDLQFFPADQARSRAHGYTLYDNPGDARQAYVTVHDFTQSDLDGLKEAGRGFVNRNLNASLTVTLSDNSRFICVARRCGG